MLQNASYFIGFIFMGEFHKKKLHCDIFITIMDVLVSHYTVMQIKNKE